MTRQIPMVWSAEAVWFAEGIAGQTARLGFRHRTPRALNLHKRAYVFLRDIGACTSIGIGWTDLHSSGLPDHESQTVCRDLCLIESGHGVIF